MMHEDVSTLSTSSAGSRRQLWQQKPFQSKIQKHRNQIYIATALKPMQLVAGRTSGCNSAKGSLQTLTQHGLKLQKMCELCGQTTSLHRRNCRSKQRVCTQCVTSIGQEASINNAQEVQRQCKDEEPTTECHRSCARSALFFTS
jgi:hypothetical protein